MSATPSTHSRQPARVVGPDFVALMVRDLEASRRFYTERLGLRPAPQSPPGAVVFDTQPVPFAVRTPAPGVDLDDLAALGGRPGLGVALWLRLSGQGAAVDALAASLTAASVPVVQAPEDGPFGRYFAVADPDGYVVTVHGDHAPVRAATRIAADAPLITLINVFEVEPARQRELVFLLEHATEEVMRHLPGFISANLHRSVDGTRVANYAQWASREAFENMLREPRAQVHMRGAAEMARAAPVLYEVASVHHVA